MLSNSTQYFVLLNYLNSGYMSPEYVMGGAFSVKTDTYSFGILLLEITSGLKISSPQLVMNYVGLTAYECMDNCTIFGS
jgi:serine/threonine protein kinase